MISFRFIGKWVEIYPIKVKGQKSFAIAKKSFILSDIGAIKLWQICMYATSFHIYFSVKQKLRKNADVQRKITISIQVLLQNSF